MKRLERLRKGMEKGLAKVMSVGDSAVQLCGSGTLDVERNVVVSAYNAGRGVGSEAFPWLFYAFLTFFKVFSMVFPCSSSFFQCFQHAFSMVHTAKKVTDSRGTAPFFYFWWQVLDGMFPGKGVAAVARKALVNQATMAPFNSALFLMWSTALEPMPQGWNRMRRA